MKFLAVYSEDSNCGLLGHNVEIEADNVEAALVIAKAEEDENSTLEEILGEAKSVSFDGEECIGRDILWDAELLFDVQIEKPISIEYKND